MRKCSVVGMTLGAAIVASGALMAPIAAQAAPAVYQCGANQDCIFEGPDYSGSVAVQAAFNPGPGPHVIDSFINSHYQNGHSMQDSASSVVNNTDIPLWLYVEAGLRGNVAVIDPHSRTNLNVAWGYVDGDFVHLGQHDFGDTVSSGAWTF